MSKKFDIDSIKVTDCFILEANITVERYGTPLTIARSGVLGVNPGGLVPIRYEGKHHTLAYMGLIKQSWRTAGFFRLVSNTNLAGWQWSDEFALSEDTVKELVYVAKRRS